MQASYDGSVTLQGCTVIDFLDPFFLVLNFPIQFQNPDFGIFQSQG